MGNEIAKSKNSTPTKQNKYKVNYIQSPISPIQQKIQRSISITDTQQKTEQKSYYIPTIVTPKKQPKLRSKAQVFQQFQDFGEINTMNQFMEEYLTIVQSHEMNLRLTSSQIFTNQANNSVKRKLQEKYKIEANELQKLNYKVLDHKKIHKKEIKEVQLDQKQYNPYRMIKKNLNQSINKTTIQNNEKQESEIPKIKSEKTQKSQLDLQKFQISNFLKSKLDDQSNIIQINIQNIQQESSKNTLENQKNYLLFSNLKKKEQQQDNDPVIHSEQRHQIKNQFATEPLKAPQTQQIQAFPFKEISQESRPDFDKNIDQAPEFRFRSEKNKENKEDQIFQKSNFMLNLNQMITKKTTNIPNFSSIGKRQERQESSNFQSPQESSKHMKESYIEEQNLSRMSFGSDMIHLLNQKKSDSNEKSNQQESDQEEFQIRPKRTMTQKIDLTQFQTNEKQKSELSQKHFFDNEDDEEKRIEQELKSLNKKLEEKVRSTRDSDQKSQIESQGRNIYQQRDSEQQQVLKIQKQEIEPLLKKHRPVTPVKNHYKNEQKLNSYSLSQRAKKEPQFIPQPIQNQFIPQPIQNKNNIQNGQILTVDLQEDSQSDMDSDEEFFQKPQNNRKKIFESSQKQFDQKSPEEFLFQEKRQDEVQKTDRRKFHLNLDRFQSNQSISETDSENSDISQANSQEQLIFQNIKCDIENLKQKMKIQ